MAYDIHEMFGMLPDLVTQGYSSPEDILSIAETGQPEKDPYEIFLENEPNKATGVIFDDVLAATGDEALARYVADGEASDLLVKTVLSDIQSQGRPRPIDTTSTLNIYSKSDYDLINLDHAVEEIMSLNESLRANAINHYSDVYGLEDKKVASEVARAQREEKINVKPWWAEEDEDVDIRMAYVEPSQQIVINPSKAVNEIVSESNPSASFLESMAMTSGIPVGTNISEQLSRSEAAKAANPEASDVESLDKLVEEITSLEEATVPAGEPTAPIGTEGSMFATGSEGWQQVLNSINEAGTTTNSYQFLYDVILNNGEIQHRYVNPSDNQVYGIIKGEYNQDHKLSNHGTLQLINEIGDYTTYLTSDGHQIYKHQIENFMPTYHRGQAPAVSPAPATGDQIASMPDINALQGLSGEQQWDAIRAAEMGDERFNPVMWDARRYGYNPARGRYLLSGGMVDGQTKGFAEWLPTSGTRDISEMWKNAVRASETMDTGQFPEGLDMEDRNLLMNLQSIMQGPNAQTNLLHMAGTGMGAGEGYISDALRRNIANEYSRYAAEQAGKGLPVGGFLSYLDNSMGR